VPVVRKCLPQVPFSEAEMFICLKSLSYKRHSVCYIRGYNKNNTWLIKCWLKTTKYIKNTNIDLNNGVDVNEVQTLNLVRLKTMRTFHAFQHNDNFLGHCATQNKHVNLHKSYVYFTYTAILTSHKNSTTIHYYYYYHHH